MKLNLFNTSNVTLHKTEKLTMLWCSFMASMIFLAIGYSIFNVIEGVMSKIAGIGLILAGIGYPILTFLAVTGRGLASKNNE